MIEATVQRIALITLTFRSGPHDSSLPNPQNVAPLRDEVHDMPLCYRKHR